MTVWFKCKACPPHSVKDHMLYPPRECLLEGCPCKHYEPDEKSPLPPKKAYDIPLLFPSRS